LLSEFELREPAGMRTEDRVLVVAAVTPTLKVVTAAMEYIISEVSSHHIHLSCIHLKTESISLNSKKEHTFTRQSKGNMPANN
jgi:hypothetical protein